MPGCNIIEEGKHVLVRLPSEAVKVVLLKGDSCISLGKFGTFSVSGVLGYKFGQSFEILENKLVKPVCSLIDDSKPLLLEDSNTFSENNQNLINTGSLVQKLSTQDIEELKKQGKGQDIINQIIAGHDSFGKKTQYSQEKYLKRKQEKFLRRFTIEYLGASEMLQYYRLKDPQRVLDMSNESLGLILSYANIRPGGNYILVDETGGVLLYAMLERMENEGSILVAHENEHPNLIALNYSNYSPELLEKMVSNLNWLQFLEADTQRPQWNNYPQEKIDRLTPPRRSHYLRKKRATDRVNNILDTVEQGNFDGLIYASTLYPPTLIPRILDTLGGSRPVVIYSPFKEILSETFHVLQKDYRILAPSIYETRVRQYQTIIGRIHPLMTTKGGGGYVLHATRVIPKEGGVTAVGRGIKSKRLKLDDSKVATRQPLE
ncbi:hypothetical protein LJB42_004156 [Komagataella kurtzmanii]|nr:hypothetical protein LJB42_004156 [Komagataella kurtzmanii]